MKSYAVLAGGGVKGAALAGCLKAAQDNGVEIVGYAGTSAGSIIALLSAIGYSADELFTMLNDELRFSELLDGDAKDIQTFSGLAAAAGNVVKLSAFVLAHPFFVRRLATRFGIYDGSRIRMLLQKKIVARYPGLASNPDPNFRELRAAGCKPLKIVASNLRRREIRVFSSTADDESSVLDAVRASMSYPFVFHPVQMGTSHFVDGGLSSNLPIHVFEEERELDGLPVVAFDLVSSPKGEDDGYSLKSFCGDMLATALESGDAVQRQLLYNVYYIPVRVPPHIGTLDFHLTAKDVSDLFSKGQAEAGSFFSKLFHAGAPQSTVQRLQITHVPPALVAPVLRAFAKVVEDVTSAAAVRTHIMLPTGNGTRIVTYHYGMDLDPDSDLELPLDAGCSGLAWKTRQTAVADLQQAKSTFATWGMSQQQQNRVRADRNAMISSPMFLPELGKRERSGKLVGVLSADSSTPLEQTGWKDSQMDVLMSEWAAIHARLLH